MILQYLSKMEPVYVETPERALDIRDFDDFQNCEPINLPEGKYLLYTCGFERTHYPDMFDTNVNSYIYVNNFENIVSKKFRSVYTCPTEVEDIIWNGEFDESGVADVMTENGIYEMFLPFEVAEESVIAGVYCGKVSDPTGRWLYKKPFKVYKLTEELERAVGRTAELDSAPVNTLYKSGETWASAKFNKISSPERLYTAYTHKLMNVLTGFNTLTYTAYTEPGYIYCVRADIAHARRDMPGYVFAENSYTLSEYLGEEQPVRGGKKFRRFVFKTASESSMSVGLGNNFYTPDSMTYVGEPEYLNTGFKDGDRIVIMTGGGYIGINDNIECAFINAEEPSVYWTIKDDRLINDKYGYVLDKNYTLVPNNKSLKAGLPDIFCRTCVKKA